jgi:hypothetical protein
VAINAVKLSLDFMLNAGPAMKGINTIKGGFSQLAAASETLKKVGGASFMTTKGVTEELYSAIAANTELTNLFGSAMKEALDLGLPTAYKQRIEDIYNVQLEGLSKVNKLSQESASFAAYQTMIESAIRGSQAVNEFTKTFEKLNIEMSSDAARNMEAEFTTLAATNDKLFKRVSNVRSEIDNLMSGVSPRQLAIYRDKLDQLNQAFNDGQIDIKQYTRQMEALNYRTDYFNNQLPQLRNAMSGLFSGVAGSWASALAAGAVINDALSAQQQSVESIHQLALRNQDIFSGTENRVRGFNETLFEYNDAVRQVARETQISMTDAASSMASLAQARVSDQTGELQELAITATRMTQAFGISEGQAAQLFRTLRLTANISPDGINAVGEALADVQATWGLTSEEASEATATIGNVINRMTAMGASSIKNANIVAREVGRMTTAFTRAGLSAQDATSMMDQFMDPTKIQDNALLWHSMGMSVSDGLAMMTGDASAMEGMTEALMQTAYDLRQEYGQNPLALQAMAEAHGLTIQKVNQLANEMEREKNMTQEMRDEIAREAELQEQANQARASAAESIKRLANIGNVLMQTFIMPMVDFLTAMAQPLMRVISGIQDFTSRLAEAGPVGKGIIEVLRMAGGAFLLFAIITKLNVIKMLRSLNILRGANGFGGLWSGIKNGAQTAMSGIKAFSKGFSRAMQQGQGRMSAFTRGWKGMTQQVSRGGAAAPNRRRGPQSPAGNINSRNTQQISRAKKSPLLEQLKSINPKQILALGAAILMISVGVAAIVASVALLAKTMENFEWYEMLTFLIGAGALIIAIFYGMSLAIGAFASVAGIAAGPILALGVAMLLLGISVALIVGSIALLVLAIGNLISQFANLSGDQLAAVGVALTQVVLIFFAFAAAMLVAAYGVAPFLLAVAGLAAAVGVIFLLAVATKALGQNILNMGNGINLFVKNIDRFIEGLKAMKQNLSGISGMSSEFVREIEKMKASLDDLTKGKGFFALAAMTLNLAGPKGGTDKDDAGTEGLAKRLDQAVEHLAKIVTHTGDTSAKMDVLISKVSSKGGFNPQPSAGLPG